MSLSIKEGLHESFVRTNDEPPVHKPKLHFQSLKHLVRSGSGLKNQSASSADTRKLRRTKSSDSSVDTRTSKLKGILKKQRGDEESSAYTWTGRKKNKKNKETGADALSKSRWDYKEEDEEDYDDLEDERSQPELTETEDYEAYEDNNNVFSRTKEIRQLVKYALKKTRSKGIVESVGGKSVLKELDLVGIVGEALQYHHEVLLCQDSFANYDELPHTFLQSIVCVFVSHLTRHVSAKKALAGKTRNTALLPQSVQAPQNRSPMGYAEEEHKELGKQRLEDDLKAALSLLENMRRNDASFEEVHEDVESACSTLTWSSDSEEAKAFSDLVSDLYCGVLDSWDGGCGWVLGDSSGHPQLIAKKSSLNNSTTHDAVAALADLPDHGDSLILDESDEYPLDTSLQADTSLQVDISLPEEEDEAAVKHTVEMTLGTSPGLVEIEHSETYEVDPDFQPKLGEEQVTTPSFEVPAPEDCSTEAVWDPFSNQDTESEGPSKDQTSKVSTESFWGTESQRPKENQRITVSNVLPVFESAAVSHEIADGETKTKKRNFCTNSNQYSQPVTVLAVDCGNEVLVPTTENEEESWDPFGISNATDNTVTDNEWNNHELWIESYEDVDAVEATTSKTNANVTISVVTNGSAEKASVDVSFPQQEEVQEPELQEESNDSKTRSSENFEQRTVKQEWSVPERTMESTVENGSDKKASYDMSLLSVQEDIPQVRISVVEDYSKKASSQEQVEISDIKGTKISKSLSSDGLTILHKSNEKQPEIPRVYSAGAAGFDTLDSTSLFDKRDISIKEVAPEQPKRVGRLILKEEEKEAPSILSSFSFDTLKNLTKREEQPEIQRVYSAGADGFQSSESTSWFGQKSGWFQNGSIGSFYSSKEAHKKIERRTASPASVMMFYSKVSSAAPTCKAAETTPSSFSPHLQFPAFST